MSSWPADFNAFNHKADSVLAVWTWEVEEHSHAVVIPDGCRDLIFEHQRSRENRFSVSDLSRNTFSVSMGAETRMTGLRLKPGTRVNEPALLAWVNNSHPEDLMCSDRLDEFCERQNDVAEALECLQSGVSVTQAARDIGVSPRTLQRKIKRLTGETPYFWLALARVRRTCRSLSEFDRLADAAAAFGYSDQAHMTREVKAWFGVTPSAVKPGSEVVAQLNEAGYG